MYEELCDRLRKKSQKILNFGSKIFTEVNARDMIAAADAIEELSKENEQFAKMAKVFVDGMNEISEKMEVIAGLREEPPKEETE